MNDVSSHPRRARPLVAAVVALGAVTLSLSLRRHIFTFFHEEDMHRMQPADEATKGSHSTGSRRQAHT